MKLLTLLSVLAEGHQWYWSYQYPDFVNTDEEFMEYDSYIIPETDLEEGELRMLEVDNRVIIPELTHTRFIVYRCWCYTFLCLSCIRY